MQTHHKELVNRGLPSPSEVRSDKSHLYPFSVYIVVPPTWINATWCFIHTKFVEALCAR